MVDILSRFDNYLFFSISISESLQTQYGFLLNGVQYTCMFLPQGYLTLSVCYHNQVGNNLQLIIIQNNSTHHTEDVLITKFLGEEVLQRVVKAVIIHMTNKDWLINLLLLLLSHFSRVRLSVTP